MDKENLYYATGKRKSSIARTWLKPGNGEITVNNRPMDDYFKIESVKTIVKQPLVLTIRWDHLMLKPGFPAAVFQGKPVRSDTASPGR